MNYYNENDKFASKWLRELIKDGLIPEGYVDDRSIEAVTPKDLSGFKQCHFFAGIGGWPRALDLAGWNPTRPVWTASLPCQPFSCAGQQQGEKDERHLWPVFFSLVKVCRPTVIVGEQVASKDGREWLSGIQTDLETLGYSCAAADLPAASVGAPHKRNRLFWVGIANGSRLEGHGEFETQDTGEKGCFRGKDGPNRQTSPAGRVADTESDHRGAGECRAETGIGPDGIGRRGSASGGFWSNSLLIPCADGKWRRVPAKWVADNSSNGRNQRRERVTETGDDGVVGNGSDDKPVADSSSGGNKPECKIISKSEREARGGPENHLEIEPALFPLADGIPGRVGLLKGAGNAIVPQVAAEFIKAVEQLI